MMHDCADGDMRDLLPDYVHGTLSAAERSAVAAHLETCADCAAEAGLIATASRAFAAPKIDTARIVKALPAPAFESRPRKFDGGAWRVAAAIGIVAIGAFSVVALRGLFGPAPQRTASTPRPAATTTIVAATPARAPVVIDSAVPLRAPAVAFGSRRSGISFGGGLSDLTDEELDTLLTELNGLDALPSAEPETHLSPIVPQTDGGHNAR